MVNMTEQLETELDWIELRNDINLQNHESGKEKLIRKIKENPLIPIGCLATVSCLGFGLWSFRQGRREMSQYMMRARIAAQAFTVLALIIGVGTTYKKQE